MHYQPDLADAKMELRSFAESLGRNPKKFTETFVTAASPGIITTTFLRDVDNPDYKTDKDYVFGIAKEMKKEYDYIVSQGHILQIDAPDLAMERAFMFQDKPLGDFLDRIKIHIDALNLALARYPAGEGAAACLLWQLGWAAYRRCRARAIAADYLQGEGRRSASPAPTRIISTIGRR